MEMQLVEQRKGKCIEIIKTSNHIHDVIAKFSKPIDQNALIDVLFADRLFVNRKPGVLTHSTVLDPD